MEGWNWEYIHIWRICGRLKGNKGGVLDVTATEVDKCRPAGFQPVLSFLEQVCVHAGGHNGRVMKGLFQLCIYELLTCHLICVWESNLFDLSNQINLLCSVWTNNITIWTQMIQYVNTNKRARNNITKLEGGTWCWLIIQTHRYVCIALCKMIIHMPRLLFMCLDIFMLMESIWLQSSLMV